MVIYKKERGGNKLGQGAVIKIWDPTVATLPDFTTMISKTFVSEIDISKIEINQDVTVTLDAFPERKYQGRIVSIANIGEERPHSHENVFEVRIELEKADRLLRPSMTTKNEIITAFQKTSLYVPLEAVYTQEDTLAFVYMEQGFEIVKRRIKTGLTNNNYCIVAEGLAPTDKILLSDPVREDYVFENVQP